MKNIFWLSMAVISMCSCSCTKDKVADQSMNAMVPGAKTYSYLALGDSYTIGESVAEDQRFPNQLAAKLEEDGKPVNVKFVAKTGWTTDELSIGIDKENIDEQKFDFVTLLIGVNNEFRNRPVSTYKLEFEILLDRAISFANGNNKRVFVVSIPDYSFTPTGAGAHGNISARIDEYNSVAAEICEMKGVDFIDITGISRSFVAGTELIAPDGLHPSGEQYRLWVEKLLPFVKAALN